jgi:peptide/nickel transport system substrate-binding protein
MNKRPIITNALALLVLASLLGCGGGDTPPTSYGPAGTPTTIGDGTNVVEGTNGATPEVDLDAPLLEPFDAPATLEEVENSVKWKEGLVVDSIDRMREWKQKSPPTTSVANALKLRNTSSAINEKILSAMSQFPAANGSNINYDATLNHAAEMDVSSLNPLLTSSIIEAQYNVLTAANLFSFDWDMVPYADGDFVSKWYSSEDGKMEKVILRDDLTWSDGKPLTAHDGVFAFQTIMNPKVPIKAVRQGTDEIRWIEAYDDHTLIYWHKKPSVVAVWNLNFPIIAKHVFEESLLDDYTMRKSKYHVGQEASPVTAGPYRLVKREIGQSLLLERREAWYEKDGKQIRHKPHFKQIRFKILADPNTRLLALKAGALDTSKLEAEDWREKTTGEDFYKHNTKVRGKEWTYFFVAWNLQSPFFADKRVRRAMSLTMDHEEMLNELCYGLYDASSGMFHKDSWMYPKSPEKPLDRFNKQDLDKAEELLEEAGWTDSDSDGTLDKVINGRLTQFEFTMSVKNAADRIRICNLYRECLEQIGIRCTVRPMESAALMENTFEKKFQATFMGWSSGADPYTNDNIFGTGKQRNYGLYSNKEVDQLFVDAMVAPTREARGELYGRIQELVYEDQPYTFLYTMSSFYGFNKRLRGYNFSPRGPYSYGPGMKALWAQ